MSDFKIGLLGCGGIANAHATALTKIKNAHLTAFCDVARERAEDFNTRYAEGKAAVYADFHAMLEREKLDAVWICLPPFAHTDEVEVAAAHGVHVFIEKPIALDLETGRRMVEAVEKAKIKSQVGFMFRFGAAVERVKEMIQSGEAGEAGWGLGIYKCNSLHSPWWRDKSKCGGQVVEQVTHTFDILRYLLGEPETVFCAMNNMFHREVEGYTVEDVAATSIKFKSGAVASVASTNGAIPGLWQASFQIACRKLTAEFADSNSATLYHTDAEPVRQTKVEGSNDLFRAEALDFLNAIANNDLTRTPMLEGYKSLQLVLAVAQSGETGEVVRL